jgi:hypothetical protein
LKFFVFCKILDTQNQTLVTIACVHVSVIAPTKDSQHYHCVPQDVFNNPTLLLHIFAQNYSFSTSTNVACVGGPSVNVALLIELNRDFFKKIINSHDENYLSLILGLKARKSSRTF